MVGIMFLVPIFRITKRETTQVGGNVLILAWGFSSPPKNSPPDCFFTILLIRFAHAKSGVVSHPHFSV